MKYSKHYSKLDQNKYTTIRRHSKGKVGDVVLETYPDGKHKANIVDIKRQTINEMSFTFLYTDTDCITREEAKNLIQYFYRKPIDFDKEKFYVYFLEKVA